MQVVVRSASDRQQQLLAVARDVVHNAEAYPGLLSVAPLIDGSGLEIGVARRSRTPPPTSSRTGMNDRAVHVLRAAKVPPRVAERIAEL